VSWRGEIATRFFAHVQRKAAAHHVVGRRVSVGRLDNAVRSATPRHRWQAATSHALLLAAGTATSSGGGRGADGGSGGGAASEIATHDGWGGRAAHGAGEGMGDNEDASAMMTIVKDESDPFVEFLQEELLTSGLVSLVHLARVRAVFERQRAEQSEQPQRLHHCYGAADDGRDDAARGIMVGGAQLPAVRLDGVRNDEDERLEI